MLSVISSLLLSIVALAPAAQTPEGGGGKDAKPEPAKEADAGAEKKAEPSTSKKEAEKAEKANKEAVAAAEKAKVMAAAAALATTKAEEAEKVAKEAVLQAKAALVQARAGAQASHDAARTAHAQERSAREAVKVAAKADVKAAEAKLQVAEERAVAADAATVVADAAVVKAEADVSAADSTLRTATRAGDQARSYAKETDQYRIAAQAYAEKIAEVNEEVVLAACSDDKFTSKSERRRCERAIRNARIEKVIERETRSFRGAMLGARAGRCGTAVCWGPGYKWALEPLVELPVGKSFSLPGSSLAKYLNSNELQVSFNAGIRLWLWWDWISISTFMSKVLVTGNDTIYTATSGVPLPASQLRRPFPGLGIGLFGDMLWISMDYDQLRNGNVMATKSPDFRPNEIVSHAFTFTIAVASIAGLRNGIGTLVEQKRRKQEEADAKKAAAEAALPATPPKVPAAPTPPAEPGAPAAVGGVTPGPAPAVPPGGGAGTVIGALPLRPRGG